MPKQLREIGGRRFVEIGRREADLRDYDLVEATIETAGPRGARYFVRCGSDKRDGKYGFIVQYLGLRRTSP